MLLKVCILLFLLYLLQPTKTEFNKTNSNGLRIELVRQKSSLEQYLKSVKYLKKHGLRFNWLFKKPTPGPRTNDSIALYRYLDHEFYGKILIGHPGQTLNVAFDTAWTLSWVVSSKCPFSNMGCYYHNKYNHYKSTSYIQDGRRVVEQDGPYNYTGFFSTDTVYIAHSNATNQSFVEMDSVPNNFIFNKIDGIFGLGLKYDNYTPFFNTLVQQQKIKVPLFSIYLNRDKQSNRGGNVILGFIEQTHIHSHKDENNNTIYDDIKYLPIKAGPYWEVDLDSVYMNNTDPKKPPLIMCDSGCTAISDTSSNTLIGPHDQVAKIHEMIQAKPWYFGKYSVNCETINKLPELGFIFGGQRFPLKGRDYTIKLSIFSLQICLSAFESGSNNFWVLGGAFLSEYYSIYDIQAKHLGLVKAA